MKKIKILLALSTVIFSQLSLSNIYADDEIYTKKKLSIPNKVTKNINNEVYIPKEYEKDINELNSLYNLESKTDSNYEIAISNSDKTYTYIESKDTLEEAIDYVNNMNTKSYSMEKGIPCIINNEGEVVYSANAMGKIIKYIDGKPYPGIDKNTNIYSEYVDDKLKSAYTYINHGYVDDVPIIEDRGKAAKIEVNGYTGWINKDASSNEYDLRVVPLNQVENPSYYINNNGTLKHYISSNIESASSGGHTLKIGKAPSFMKENTKYYSYDGNYFYKDLDALISDTKNGDHKNSVNANEPYYLYYQYLPFRSKTSYSAKQIDEFINNNTKDNSKLRNLGSSLIEAQNKYGVNAAMILGVAINESNWGMSSISQSKNNLFGIKAFDSNVSGSTKFDNPKDSVIEFAKNYISKGYADPKDWRYRGAHLGNKSLGANVKYASDPFWGEKASQYTYILDYQLSGNSNDKLRDNNEHSLAIHANEKSIFNRDKEVLYNIDDELVGTPMILTSNENYNNYYEIVPDRPVGVNENFDGTYNLNTDAYAKVSGIKPINESKGFYDINGHWAQEIIKEFISKGHVGGYEDGTFRPNNEITRAEFVKITNHVFGFNDKKEKEFKDVKESDWFYEELKIAIGAGYIGGYEDNTFRPNSPITREEVASIITHITKTQDSNLDKLREYKDANKVSPWAKPSVEGAIENRFMGGYEDNTFRPKSKITRAEAVVTLSRMS